MKSLQALTLRASIALFAGIAALALVVLGGIALSAMDHAEAMASRVLLDVKSTRAAGSVDMMHDALRGDVLAARLAGGNAPEAERQTIREARAKHSEEMRESLAQVAAEGHAEGVRRELAAAQPAAVAYIERSRAAVDAALAGQADGAAQKAFDQDFAELEVRLEKLSESIEASAAATVAQQASTTRTDRWTIAAAGATTLLVMTVYGLMFVRGTMARLGAEPVALNEVTGRVADGDLTAGFATVPPAGSVADAMLRMQARLASLVAEVRQNAEALASASAQIAQGNVELSSRTEEQAGALQQTSASMEQLGASVTQNADSAQQASALATAASAVARRSSETVGEVVATMKGIDDASRRIADIIGVVDGIAFQTNILALNAAVEAARAGEQGRGFAVVASEVRTLAGRAGDAAKEIRHLVATTQERVGAGNAQVERARHTLDELVGGIERVTALMTDVSHASAEQRNGVGQSAAALGQIDQVTQQNAALVEESAAAAESLKHQASRLVEVVAVFRTGDATDVPAAPTPAVLARAVVAKAAARAAGRSVPAPVAATGAWESF